MISIYELKPRFQKLLAPATAAMYRAGITANMVTVAATVLSITYGVLLLIFPTSRAVLCGLSLFLLARMALNAIDGVLAREYRQKSNLGALLNEVGDVISDVALYIPFAFFAGVTPITVISLLFLALISEFIGVLAQTIGAQRCYDGPMGKSDRAFLFGAIALLMGLGMHLGYWLDGIFIVVSILLTIGCLNRARSALRG